MYSLGRAEYGRLGLGQGAEEKTEPALVTGVEAACNVTCGASVSFAVTREGEKRCSFICSTIGIFFLCLHSRICVRLGDGHKPAAWHRRRGGRVEPCEDDGEAVGKPRSTDGLQRGAAHGPVGQRQAGELIPASTWEGRGHFIGVLALFVMLKVGNGADQCLRHCLAWKWTKFSLLLCGILFFLVWIKPVYRSWETVFLKILFLAFSERFSLSLVWLRVNKGFKWIPQNCFNFLFLCVWHRWDVCTWWILHGAVENTVISIRTCLWILLYTAFCCLSYQENKVYSYVFLFLRLPVPCVNYLTNSFQFPVFKTISLLPVAPAEQPVFCNMWLHQFLFVYWLHAIFCLYVLNYAPLSGQNKKYKRIMYYQEHSGMLMIEQVLKSKRQVFVLWRVNSEAHLPASSSFHLAKADKGNSLQRDEERWSVFHERLM